MNSEGENRAGRRGWGDGLLLRNTGCFAEDQGSVSSTHMAAHNRPHLHFQQILLLASMGTECIHVCGTLTCTQAKCAHTHKIKINKIFFKR